MSENKTAFLTELALKESEFHYVGPATVRYCLDFLAEVTIGCRRAGCLDGSSW